MSSAINIEANPPSKEGFLIEKVDWRDLIELFKSLSVLFFFGMLIVVRRSTYVFSVCQK